MASASLYSWKEATASHHTVSAEDAAKELDRIASQTDLTPEAVVQAARPPSAVLHPEFEWDDAVAAEEWRKEQARHLIAHIVVTYPQQNKDPLQVRAFQSLKVPQDGFVFVRTEAALSESDARMRLLTQALRDLLALEKRYRDLQELASVFAAVEMVKKALDAANQTGQDSQPEVA